MPEISANAARAADLLLILGEAGSHGLGLKDLAERTGDSRPALHRALAALAQRGFVEPGDRRGSYRLGPAIPGLARRNASVEAQLTVMRPVLYDIVAETGYSAFLMVEAGLDALCLELVSPAPVRSLTGGAGGRVPLGIAAGSLAILSTLTAESRTAVLRANAARYASYPAVRPMSAAQVSNMVEETRLNGYSNDFGCFFPGEGGIGIAVPPRGARRSGLSVAIQVIGEIAGPESLAGLAQRVQTIFAARALAV